MAIAGGMLVLLNKWRVAQVAVFLVFMLLVLTAGIVQVLAPSAFTRIVIERVPETRPAHAAQPAAARPTAKPALYFRQGASAQVPYCHFYAVQVHGVVTAGFQVVMFDAATDGNGNVVGQYNFDGQAKPNGTVPGFLEVRYLTIGPQSPKTGFTAVVIAAVIADKEANILEAVRAAPTGWHLQSLPVLLTSKSLQVTRNSNDASCRAVHS
jgi:hypothetical protein